MWELFGGLIIFGVLVVVCVVLFAIILVEGI